MLGMACSEQLNNMRTDTEGGIGLVYVSSQLNVVLSMHTVLYV